MRVKVLNPVIDNGPGGYDLLNAAGNIKKNVCQPIFQRRRTHKYQQKTAEYAK
jgi:hypothetical protein